MDFFKFLIDYIIVIIYDSFICLVIVLLIFYIFKIKDTNIKILFLFLPLIKPFLVITEDFNLNHDFFNKRTGVFGLRFITPNLFLNRLDTLDRSPIDYSNISSLVVIILLSSIFIVLLFRWLNLYIFYKRLAYSDVVSKKEIPYLYEIIDNYSDRMELKPPTISLTHENLSSPFVIGIKKHTMVLTPLLIENLSSDETKVLLLHELSHIKRKDNLIGWLALIFKDLLFFNPFAYIAYYLIKFEQEKGSDKLVCKFLNYDKKEIAKHTINLIIKIKNIRINKKIATISSMYSQYTPFQRINFQILSLRINSILAFNPLKIEMRLLPRLVMFLLFFLILFIQILFIININDLFILLR